jgi:DNA-binding transcriptional ArsR family regulator
MHDTSDLARVAALMGDPTRAAMLGMLMHGRAHTATELALESGVSPSTASGHLARLTDAGLVAIARQGRHRYFRIASPEVAAAIEGLMSIAPRDESRSRERGAREEQLRAARVCYDHLAGEAAVRMLERLRESGLVRGGEQALALTARGEEWCARIGIDLGALAGGRRPLCRPCLDWTERRTHLAGALGAAILDRLFTLRFARRVAGSRAVILSPRGESFVAHLVLAR